MNKIEQQERTAPHVLLATAKEWISTARLAMVLHGMGVHVDLLAPASHPARVLGVFEKTFTYHPLWPLRNLEHALRESHATTIIAADEITLHHLQELAMGDSDFAASVRSLLRRSVGEPVALHAANSRMMLLDLAREEGIATPDTVTVLNENDMEAAAERFGWPLVLKADGSSGGQGVRVVANLSQARTAFRLLYGAPSLVRVLKRAFVGKEWTHFRPWMRRETRSVTAQRFVSGGERTGMAVGHEGKLLACVSLEVVQASIERGPSSVLRIVDDPVMECAMRKMMARLGVTGFCGFDFMLDPDTGQALLIEMNSRPTQTAHLAAGSGRDLVAAYVRECLGLPYATDRKAATQKSLIALFPQELTRDPESELLALAYHDVPWASPRLVEVALDGGASRLMSSRPQTSLEFPAPSR